MKNKNIALKTISSTPVSSHYRSFKYRVNNSTTLTNSKTSAIEWNTSSRYNKNEPVKKSRPAHSLFRS
jgi:hypothetical protein